MSRVPPDPTRPAAGACRARRLGFFGGSFDPPHAGHLQLARAALAARSLEHVLWVPASVPPHKPGRRLASGVERVRMLELLLAGEGREHSIWGVELDRPPPSFTVDTLRLLEAHLAEGAEVFLLLGSDNLRGLPAWRDVSEILARAQPLVLPRRGAEVDPRELAPLGDELRGRVLDGVIEWSGVDVSSTELRARLASGCDVGDDLPRALRDYVRERGIYAAP